MLTGHQRPTVSTTGPDQQHLMQCHPPDCQVILNMICDRAAPERRALHEPQGEDGQQLQGLRENELACACVGHAVLAVGHQDVHAQLRGNFCGCLGRAACSHRGCTQSRAQLALPWVLGSGIAAVRDRQAAMTCTELCLLICLLLKKLGPAAVMHVRAVQPAEVP